MLDEHLIGMVILNANAQSECAKRMSRARCRANLQSKCADRCAEQRCSANVQSKCAERWAEQSAKQCAKPMCNARVQNNVQGNVQSNVHCKYASQMRKANAQLGQVSLFTETNVPAQERIMPIRRADTCRADPIHAKPISVDP